MRRVVYPWDEWFRLGAFTILKGCHYHCSNIMMAQQVRNAASARGLSSEIRESISQGDLSLIVRISERTPDLSLTEVPPVEGIHHEV